MTYDDWLAIYYIIGALSVMFILIVARMAISI